MLLIHSRIADELRERGIARSSNNPTGNLAEYLFCKAFGWNQADRSCARSIDAVGEDGKRYQIKARRITRHNGSRQLTGGDLNSGHFDILAGVILREDYTVLRAALIPHAVALRRATFVERTNSHRFLLRDDIWNDSEVEDVTELLRTVELNQKGKALE